MATGNEPNYTIADILKATDYALTIFEDEERAAIELFDRKGKPYLRDFVAGRSDLLNQKRLYGKYFSIG